MLRGAGRASTPARPAWLEARLRATPRSDYDFLLGSHIDQATLDRARALAARIGVPPHEVLIANGWLTAEAYARAMADEFAVPFRPALAPTELAPLHPWSTPRDMLRQPLRKLARANSFVVVADLLAPNDLSRILASIPRQQLAISASPCARRALVRKLAPELAANATERLAERHPEQSAQAGLALWQIVFLSLVLPGFVAWSLFDFRSAMGAASVLLGLAFIPIIALRVFALINLRSRLGRAPSATARIPDAELPIYTILAPLYREANMVPGLAAALARLDYPALGSKRTKAKRNSKMPFRPSFLESPLIPMERLDAL